MTRPEADAAADFFLEHKESVEGHALQFSMTIRSKLTFTTQPTVRAAFAAKGIRYISLHIYVYFGVKFIVANRLK